MWKSVTSSSLKHLLLVATWPGTVNSCLCFCSEQVMEEFLTCAKQASAPEEAIKLVKLAASLGLPSSQRLKSRTKKEFELSEEQK